MIDFRIESFYTLCQTKSFTKTAQELYITQPAVTQHIKFLEEYYGGKLVEYREKKLKLTERGKKLYEYVKTIIADSKRIQEEIKNIEEKNRHLKIGATLSIAENIIPRIVKNIVAEKPFIKIGVTVENTKQLLNKIDNAEIEFAMIEGFFDKNSYGYRLFSNEDFIAVTNIDSKYIGKKNKLSDLFKEKLILRERGSGSRNILEQALFEKNLTLESFRDIIEIGNIAAIKELVKNGTGITFVYKAAVEKELIKGELAKIEIEDFNLKREFNFVYLQNSIYESEYLEWLKKIENYRWYN